jgi:hypothetical protein
MSEYNIFKNLNSAHGRSTHSKNYFSLAIKEIEWDNVFEADGETYYCLKGFTLQVENINPMIEQWKPTVTFSDGSVISLGE